MCLVCKSSQHVQDEHHFVFDTVILESHMQLQVLHLQAFFSKPLLCQTFLLGVNQMHVVVSLEAVFP